MISECGFELTVAANATNWFTSDWFIEGQTAILGIGTQKNRP
jgi:hypothetical protein